MGGICRDCGALAPRGADQCETCYWAECDTRARVHTDRRDAVYGRGGTYRDPFADDADQSDPALWSYPTPASQGGASSAFAVLICVAIGVAALIALYH